LQPANANASIAAQSTRMRRCEFMIQLPSFLGISKRRSALFSNACLRKRTVDGSSYVTLKQRLGVSKFCLGRLGVATAPAIPAGM
jgi:hypothetical protein